MALIFCYNQQESEHCLLWSDIQQWHKMKCFLQIFTFFYVGESYMGLFLLSVHHFPTWFNKMAENKIYL